METQRRHDRDEEARAILVANDRGGFSVPTRGLYPFQWNWDSAFAALGYSRVDPERAVRELETLAAAQWGDGMIPHIIFHRPDPGYFPGPDVWATGTTPPTSGITQPPVFAIALARLAERGHVGGARLAPLVEAADRWHRWFFAARRDEATGVIGVVHPWESGCDNMPSWDAPLAAVSADGIQPFERRDTGHIDAAMRPTREQYERYIALVEFGRSVGWDQVRIRDSSPFFVGDPGITAILIRAERALRSLAEGTGRAELAAAVDHRVTVLTEGMDALWSDVIGAYAVLDLRTGNHGTGVSNTSFFGFLAGIPSREKAAALTEHFDRIAGRCRFMTPSYDPDAPEFDEKRYWRGPVWLIANWLIAMGLEESGDLDRAGRLRGDSRELVETGGFYEYYSALDGAPLGGADFTWTAAAWLDWAGGD